MNPTAEDAVEDGNLLVWNRKESLHPSVGTLLVELNQRDSNVEGYQPRADSRGYSECFRRTL